MSKYTPPPATDEFTKFIGVGHVLCTVGYVYDDFDNAIDHIRVTNEDGLEVSAYMSDSDWNDLEMECEAHQNKLQDEAKNDRDVDMGEDRALYEAGV